MKMENVSSESMSMVNGCGLKKTRNHKSSWTFRCMPQTLGIMQCQGILKTFIWHNHKPLMVDGAAGANAVNLAKMALYRQEHAPIPGHSTVEVSVLD